MQPLLSILIPTTIDRSEEYYRLINRLKIVYPNIYKDGLVEEITDHAGKEVTIGEKREGLYQYARGVYSWSIDDDDDISDDSIELILNAIKDSPDCITFQEKCVINGQYFSSNHSLKYDMWRDNHDGFNFTRSPFYKDVIKTEIARTVPFPHIRWNEDEQWSMRLYPYLKNEIHIDKELYYYIHNSKPEDHNERYGIV